MTFSVNILTFLKQTCKKQTFDMNFFAVFFVMAILVETTLFPVHLDMDNTVGVRFLGISSGSQALVIQFLVRAMLMETK